MSLSSIPQDLVCEPFKKMADDISNSFNPELRPCPVSGSRGKALQCLGPVAVTQGGAYSSSNFNLVYCEKADVVYLDPLPDARDFEVMYGAGQFASAEYTDPHRVESMLQYYGSCIERHFNLRQGERFRLLEVGAGLSWVSRAMKNINQDSTTFAQDISAECKDVCAWVDEYFVGSLEDFCAQHPERYDAISMTHVIEHVPDPLDTLKILAGMLAPDGVIFVTAPARPTGWLPEQGLEPWLNYAYLHVPAHITYFSETSLRLAAEQAGLSLRYWDGSHESGQAFESVLSPACGRGKSAKA